MTQQPPRRSLRAWRIQALGLAFVIIGICETLLLIDVIADLFHLDISTVWIDHTFVELASVVTLGLVLLAMGLTLRDLVREHKNYQDTVKAASGQLISVIFDKFDTWKLSASERDIAMMLIKGFSVQEIADLRTTKPGTIKSQSNAIYRKANLHGRNELVAYFVEDLLAGDDLIQRVPSQ